ncbi:MAG: hypothetical protein AVDCRST_MAG66-1283, partial [uncultured Pseudonocardia sp.]
WLNGVYRPRRLPSGPGTPWRCCSRSTPSAWTGRTPLRGAGSSRRSGTSSGR